MTERLAIPGTRDLAEELAVSRPWWQCSACFNVAVSHSVPVARMYGAESEGVMMRWGLLVPGEVAGTVSFGPALVQSESLLSHAAVRGAWLNGQRGILPVAGFYVWQRHPGGFRQPHYVRVAARRVFGLAVVWQRCTSSEDDVLESCALVTVRANPLLAGLDNTGGLMPAILRREQQDEWLRANAARARDMLAAYPEGEMAAHPVGPYVNHLVFDGPHLIQAAGAHGPGAQAGRSPMP